MQSCQKCESERIMYIMGHCVDRFVAEMQGREYGPDYVPGDMGLGRGGDDIKINICLNCGQIQGEWPVHPECFEEDEEDE